MTDPQPANWTRTGCTTPRTGGVSKSQWAVLIVACLGLVFAVPIVLGVGHALVPAFAGLCALELLLCVGLLVETEAAIRDRCRP